MVGKGEGKAPNEVIKEEGEKWKGVETDGEGKGQYTDEEGKNQKWRRGNNRTEFLKKRQGGWGINSTEGRKCKWDILVFVEAILKQDRAGVSLYHKRKNRDKERQERERRRERSQPKTPSNAPQDRSCAPWRSAAALPSTHPSISSDFQREHKHNIYDPRTSKLLRSNCCSNWFGHSGSVWIQTTHL